MKSELNYKKQTNPECRSFYTTTSLRQLGKSQYGVDVRQYYEIIVKYLRCHNGIVAV